AGLRHCEDHDGRGPGTSYRAYLDAGGTNRLFRCANGHGKCHGIYRDPAFDHLHRNVLPQACFRTCANRSGVVIMATNTLSNNQHRLLRRVKKFAYLVGLFIAMSIICLPGLWIVLSSLRPPVEIMAKPPVWIPETITLDAYYAMFSGAGGGGIPVWDYFRNSLIISITSTIIALIVGVSGGYAFARFRFWGKSTTFLGLMLTR